MKKVFLFIVCFALALSTLQANIYYSGSREKQYNYEPVYKDETIIDNDTPATYNAKVAVCSIRLILSGYDDIVLELTSNESINDEIYLLFTGGILKPMKRYSSNVYYYVFDNYMELDTVVFLNNKNIFVDKKIKKQMQSDYNYMAEIVNDRYNRDRYYRDYNFQYKK